MASDDAVYLLLWSALRASAGVDCACDVCIDCWRGWDIACNVGSGGVCCMVNIGSGGCMLSRFISLVGVVLLSSDGDVMPCIFSLWAFRKYLLHTCWQMTKRFTITELVSVCI